jgi:hypothetical protein
MKRVTVCLGILFALVTSSYAQDSSSDTSNRHGQTATNDSSPTASNASQMKTQTRDHEATATPSKQHDQQTSGKETHFRLGGGGVAVSATYAHFWPGIYPSYPYGFPYGPFYSPISAAQWWDPFWGFFPVVYPAGYFSPGDGKGEVKLHDAPRNASVYLNGGYAGTVEHLKSFWLEPGVYDLVLSAPDGRQYQQRVYVLTGKTLRIEVKLAKPMTEGERM